jgi:3-dehydroquinate dehydratase type I
MGSPKICVVITASDMEGVLETARRIEALNPDFIEVRLDYIEGTPDLYEIRGASRLPMIATNRGTDHGGLSTDPDSDRVEMLLNACEVGFEYADVELDLMKVSNVAVEVRDRGAQTIISHHDFMCTPEKRSLNHIMKRMIIAGADICKIVGMSNTPRDNLRYLNLIQENLDVNLVCFGMGETGLLSRVFSPVFGGAFTYASTERGRESAPGQLTIAELRQIYALMGV